MRKIILSVAVSLDGLMEGPTGEYDWCPAPSRKEMNDFLDKIDTVLLGRKSFELTGATPFKNKAHYIFSTTLKRVKGAQVIGADVRNKILEIKNQPGKDIWLFGGARLITFFMNGRLVDEMALKVVPVVLGKGKPLFTDINQITHFRLVEATPKEGYLSLYYQYDPK